MSLEVSPKLETRIRNHAARRSMTIEQLLDRAIPENEPQPTPTAPPNERLIETLKKISAMNEGRPITSDGSDTKRLLHEARAGAMYGYDPPDATIGLIEGART